MSAFKDNVVVLTGASMGIGEQLAYQLADQSAKLVLAARSADKLEGVAVECRKRGGEAIAIPTDLTHESQCQQLIARAIDTYGRIDTLLYNAGRAFPKRFAEQPNLDAIRAETALNYLGLVCCAYYALPHLKQTRGRIVGVGSLNSHVGVPGTIGYNASKHALRGFLNTLRAELIGTGVSVTQVYLGAILTERLRETMGDNVQRIPTMTPQRSAQLILEAAARRRRHHLQTLGVKLAVWLYGRFPGLMERQLLRIADLYVAE